MLTYTYEPSSEQLLVPEPFRSTKHTSLYDPPIEEFSVLLTRLEPGQQETHEAIDGPSIFIVVEGDGSKVQTPGLETGNHAFEQPGEVFFVGAGTPLSFSAGEKGLILYRAFVEAPHS